MKIVINACHGGFDLSPEAIKYIAEKTGEAVYWFGTVLSEDFKIATFQPISVEELNKSVFGVRAFKVSNPNELSEEARREHAWNTHNIPRNDPVLVEAVEVLGQKADGDFAELKVVEIPDDVEWVIQEYDGYEWIAEKHRTWH